MPANGPLRTWRPLSSIRAEPTVSEAWEARNQSSSLNFPCGLRWSCPRMSAVSARTSAIRFSVILLIARMGGPPSLSRRAGPGEAKRRQAAQQGGPRDAEQARGPRLVAGAAVERADDLAALVLLADGEGEGRGGGNGRA